MKTIFNIMTTISFLGVVTIGAGAGYLYVNRDSLAEKVKAQVTAQVTEAVSEAVTGAFGGASMGTELAPSLPTTPSVPGLPF